MAKVCIKEFPLGSYPNQEKPGFYMDGLKQANLDILARNITKDMQFVGLYSGDGTVRNGKSTLAQQDGYYYSKKVSEHLGYEVPFTMRNIVFRAKDLIIRAKELPRYSCIILDEGDDLTAHYLSRLSQELSKFFRKSGQLNLFIILILPDFFEMKKGIAIVRSNYLCNVKFRGEFDRGYYDFYGPRAKKFLYINGKKNADYRPKGSNPDFRGRFPALYMVDEQEYREAKAQDLEEDEQTEKLTPKRAVYQDRVLLFGRTKDKIVGMTIKKLSEVWGVGEKTAQRYYRDYKLQMTAPLPGDTQEGPEIIKGPIVSEINGPAPMQLEAKE